MRLLRMHRFLSLALVLTLAAGAAPAGARTYAKGRATYGYSHGGHHYYGGHHHSHSLHVGYYGYYGYPYYYGRPYAYVGYYYPRAYYAAPAYVVERGSARALGAVETDVRPKRAQVLLDGKPVGQARDFNGPWDLLILPEGTHSLEFAAPGRMTLRVQVEVRAGGYYRLEESLLEGSGEDPRSDPLPPPTAAAPEAGPEPASAVAARGGEDVRVAAPSLKQGRLHISASPADAAVYLDGEFLARADELSRLHGAIPVAQGPHTIEVVRPGYESGSLDVLVAEEPERVSIDLKPRD